MALIVSDLQILTPVKLGEMVVCLNQLNWHKGGLGSVRKVGLQQELKLLWDCSERFLQLKMELL